MIIILYCWDFLVVIKYSITENILRNLITEYYDFELL